MEGSRERRDGFEDLGAAPPALRGLREAWSTATGVVKWELLLLLMLLPLLLVVVVVVAVVLPLLLLLLLLGPLLIETATLFVMGAFTSS